MNQRSLRILILLLLFSPGCWRGSENEVVVFTALDEQFSAPIFEEFTQDSGIDVLASYDTESTKTVGLVQKILRQRNRPQCDLFWNNEILHTLRLEEMGLLDVYLSPSAENYPEEVRSPEGYWHGFAARARVLIVNTELVSIEDRPDSILDLVDPRWKGQVGIARPLFGTSATHATVLFSHWGDEQAKAFYQQLKENTRVVSGNKQVALAVARGELAFGLTDTDDAIIEIDHGHPVAIVFPDSGEGEMGTLLIPNTLCLIKNSPHPESARQLVDHLLSAKVEEELAAGHSAQFPLNTHAESSSRIETPEAIHWMPVDWYRAASEWESSATILQKIFLSVE